MKELLTSEAAWPKKVRTAAEAVKFLDAVGFCLLFPVKRLPLPSLYCAVAGRSEISPAKEWDKHCMTIWRWKDELPRKGQAWYGKYFKARGTFLSLAMLRNMLAMRESAAAAGDAERFYRDGRITATARAVWETLESHGPLATLELRHACKMDSKAGNIRFKRAMLELQCLLVVTHFGAEQETDAWASGRFELTWRAFPRQTAAAHRPHSIGAAAARAAIAAKYLEWHTGTPPAVWGRLFGWNKAETREAIAKDRIRTSS